jgi:Cdc6-like AAA superfamily ATPase
MQNQFNPKINSIWKLGCNWGKGNPSFYEFIKSRSIVIGVEDKPFKPGDLIAISEGYNVKAIALIKANNGGSTSDKRLEQHFNSYGIEYESWVHTYESTWKELETDQEFEYKLQSGIRKIQQQKVKDQIIDLWFNRNAVKSLLVNTTWNSNDWKETSVDHSNHKYVKSGNVPHESWNFDFNNARNDTGRVKGYAQFTHSPKVNGSNNLLVFYSDRKIVGFYGKAEVLKEYQEINENESYNLSGDKSLSLVLENKLEAIPDYLEGKKRIGQIGFNNINKKSTSIQILKDAIKINPNQKEKLNKILQWLNSDNSQSNSGHKEKRQMKDLNIILFGPPGTGKTYNTINKALELCGDDVRHLPRNDIKSLFEQRVDEGRIIFTTFHQSMTYEDFVEGIKPIEPDKEGDPVIYKIEEGIFRKLCIEASFSLAKEDESVATENVLDFSLAYDNFIQEIEEQLISEKIVELASKNGGKVVVDGVSQQGNISIKHVGGTRNYTVSKSRLTKLQSGIENLDDVSNINTEFRAIIGGSNSSAYWAVLNAIRENSQAYIKDSTAPRKYTWEDKREVVSALSKNDYKGKTGESFVIIIDEINRGSVSQIFGELITLIEEDKRLGNPEAIQVQLPYSKDWFGVPPNVHIIGTMNTADRSVEALDTALRRRFSFTEMPPKPELIKTEGKAKNGIVNGIDLSTLLETINKRIEKLLDKDHMIGHSYFLSVEGLIGLKSALQNKIIPLLQEYFFGDYGKIGLVIGSMFFDIKDNQVDEDFFAPFEDYDSSPLVERKVYHLKNILEMSDELFVQALNELQRKSN